MPKIFVSYRREDTAGHAGRLYDHLLQHFGAANLFMDIDTLEPGIDFVSVVERTLRECDVLLAVIGPRWLTISNASGKRRIDSENDFVRLEIETALARNIRTVPVLVQFAEMPSPEQLPATLAPLARRHAIDLTDVRWAYDVRRLIETLERIPGHGARHDASPRGQIPVPASLTEAPSRAKNVQNSEPQRAKPNPDPRPYPISADTSQEAARLNPPTKRSGLTIVGVGLIVASLAFAGFSWYCAQWYDNLDRTNYEQFSEERETLHQAVKLFSITYYVLCCAFFVALFRWSKGKRVWSRVLAIILSVGMFGWSFLLSGAISFNEVFPAWILSALVLGALAIIDAVPIDSWPSLHKSRQP